ncbi:TetR/AcrR family transcriptional regulator [Humibacter ginsenosidimutans]|uniref:TetR/AcrR family transcriptional regulator n=1 Tax=Humibacter ginsenosidimutans TaxID=2599293 RepID=A0A5B8M3W1_9MICO|nr:TetR/AcrR family transcriptional regulator [Humibacter ginsenosidimutans]QDZ14624.1 TetR/AcrR family transcriptional regulator [Humibacter ginsenosidimutans]
MPKAIDHDQRRREIIDVTWRLIVKGGLEAATMREIAAEAGFANGALKHYFPGKDDIITGAYQLSMDRVISRLTSAAQGLEGIDALRAIVRGTLPLDQESRESARVLLAFWERGLSSQAIKDSYEEHLASWRRDLTALIGVCRRQGAITSETPDETIADELILFNIGATVLSAIGPSYARPEMLERMIDDQFAKMGVPAELAAVGSAQHAS